MNRYDQQWETASAASRAGLLVDDIWVHYVRLGGSTDAVAISAYLHGLVILDLLQRNIVSHAVNALIDESPQLRDLYSTPSRQDEGTMGYGFASVTASTLHAPFSDEETDPSGSSVKEDPAQLGQRASLQEWRDVSWPKLTTRVHDMFDPAQARAHQFDSLKKTGLLLTGQEERFDRITRLARTSLDMPFATMTFIDRGRQFVKSISTPAGQEPARYVSLENSFCAHTIAADSTLIIPDTLTDPRFAANPFVTGTPGIRFYAGHPLLGSGGWRIGALCVMDTSPRAFTATDQRQLRVLAAVTHTEINGV